MEERINISSVGFVDPLESCFYRIDNCFLVFIQKVIGFLFDKDWSKSLKRISDDFRRSGAGTALHREFTRP